MPFLMFGFSLVVLFVCVSSSVHAASPITGSGLNTHVSPPVTLPSGQTQHNITGGTRPGGGTNLFHSFGNFNVPNNNIANSNLLLATYEDPPRPKVTDISKELAEKRFAQRLTQARRDREEVRALYEGKGTGSGSEAAKGTAWGYYNAVVEYEDYGRKNTKPEGVLVGKGAEAKERAFAEALKLC